jgi:hypothetical protein
VRGRLLEVDEAMSVVNSSSEVLSIAARFLPFGSRGESEMDRDGLEEATEVRDLKVIVD